ncbi:MAG: molybdopterin-binding protein [Alphaproteobacteria bacterium]|nr:molybdopterin-binding protein [Alphaproteobacteria bacterium]
MSKQHRRHFLSRFAALASPLLLGGCADLDQTPWWTQLLGSTEALTKWAQRLFAGSHALAQEFPRSAIAPKFRPNGTLDPGTDAYRKLAANGFRDYRLEIEGLVTRPISLSLAQLMAMPARTQITRHDCVEGWSCIGEWTGVQLARVLALAGPKPSARHVVFYCMDPMGDSFGDAIDQAPYYYETLDLLEATHPQTLLAYRLNGGPLPVANGAPLRVRAERQLGYKQAKFVERIELVSSFEAIRGGKGGYWEDLGYEQWGGI